MGLVALWALGLFIDVRSFRCSDVGVGMVLSLVLLDRSIGMCLQVSNQEAVIVLLALLELTGLGFGLLA